MAERTAALQASEHNYRLLATLIPQIVWTAGPDGEIEYYNQRWYEYTGLTAEQSFAHGWQGALHPDDLQRSLEQWYKALESGRSYQIDYRLRRSDGTYRWHLGYAAAAWNDRGQVIKWFGTSTDIHDRKELEEQLRQSQKIEAVGRLAGGIAHDFNNLLTVIASYTEMVLEDVASTIPNEQQDQLREVFNASQRASNLTQQLLAFSRRQVLQPQVIDLNSVVTGLEKMLRRLIGEDVELSCNSASRLWTVLADPGQVEQVIVNLVVNARDAMPKGGKIAIETENTELDELCTQERENLNPGEYVMLAVSDTGHGMDAETKGRLFEPFFTTKAVGRGTGLGLSTAYGIVKQSGGDIWVYSEPHRGTTFKVYLPRASASIIARVADAPQSTLTGSGIILIVEDEQSLRKLASVVLSNAGYTVLTARNGEEALEILEQHGGCVDLTISDIVMPGMDAFELRNRLQAAHPGSRMLLMSGYTEHAVLRMNEIVDAFIQKPFTARQLTDKVHEALAHRAPQNRALTDEENGRATTAG